MLSNLQKVLGKTKKYKLWQEAYLYRLCHETVWAFLDANLSLAKEELQIFLKSSQAKLRLTLASRNPTLLSWLKTHQEELDQRLSLALAEKSVTIDKIEWKFRGN
jgi:hypothetical protein